MIPWQTRFTAAESLFAAAAYADAEAEYAAVIIAAPKHLPANIGASRCARKRADHAASLRYFDAAAMQAAPGDPWPRVELAADLREMQETAQAEALYREVLAMLPGNLQALLGLGFCARLRGERAAARAHFEAATRADSADAAPWLEIAVEQREAGELDAAIATANAVLARHPDNIHAMLSIGQSERHAARHEAALAAFTTAHQAHPANAEPLVEMAISARTLGRQQECDALLAQALTVDPRNVSAIVRLAEQAMIAQNIVEALQIYQRAVAEQPGQLAFHLGIVNALAGLGDFETAIAAAEALEAERGSLPAIVGQRISLLRQIGDYAAALALARHAAQANPTNVQLWSELFHTEILAGTEQDIAACLASAPAHTAHQKASLRRHRGQFAETCWRFGEALMDYEAAAAANPNDAGLQQDLVRIKTLFLDLEAARQHLRKFCELTAYNTRLRKKSLNISQTQYGQILDEYRLDSDVLAAVKPLLTLPPGAQLAALPGIVRANPDSTVAAVSLMIALRQAGAFAQQAPLAAGSLIPKTIMQYWDAPEPPADITRLMATWRAANPDFTIRVFNHEDTVWFSTGPALLTRAFTHVLAGHNDAFEGITSSGIVVLDRRELSRAVSIHCAAAYKRTDRHWLNSTFGPRNGNLGQNDGPAGHTVYLRRYGNAGDPRRQRW